MAKEQKEFWKDCKENNRLDTNDPEVIKSLQKAEKEQENIMSELDEIMEIWKPAQEATAEARATAIALNEKYGGDIYVGNPLLKKLLDL